MEKKKYSWKATICFEHGLTLLDLIEGSNYTESLVCVKLWSTENRELHIYFIVVRLYEQKVLYKHHVNNAFAASIFIVFLATVVTEMFSQYI